MLLPFWTKNGLLEQCVNSNGCCKLLWCYTHEQKPIFDNFSFIFVHSEVSMAHSQELLRDFFKGFKATTKICLNCKISIILDYSAQQKTHQSMVLKRFFGFHGFEKITNLEYTEWPNKFSIISVESYKLISAF